MAAGRFGMALFLTALGVLFLATLVGVIVVRMQLVQQGQWPSDLPAPPGILWLSTLLLIVSGFSAQRAYTAAMRDAPDTARRMLTVTLVLGALFLAAQSVGWWRWSASVGVDLHGRETFRLAQTGFYLLTGLHAAHVIGGLAGLAWSIRQARRDRFAAIRFNVVYWHFLGVVWVLIYAFLLGS